MSAPSLDRLAEDFERLSALPIAQRETALAALTISEDERDMLRRLLAADSDPDDPLARALEQGVAQLSAPRSERLGPYRLLRELGAGGMGTVFLAERVDGGFDQRVAVKILRGFPTADGLRRLRQERQILAGLDHPNIARLLDGGETAQGQPWLALEHVDGLTLLDYAARHAPRLTQRLALFDAILDAIGHAHQHLVVHRDIKPANVLVNAAGEVKLLDFGIARLVDLDTGAAARDTSTRVFTEAYASPEQREGRAITTASDIYSLGVLLRELVQGSPRMLATPLPALPLDAELAGILAKACAQEPTQRYASAGEFRDDLDRYRDGRPVRAARITRAYRLRKFVLRHRLAVLAAIVVTAMLAAFVWRLDRERARALAAEALAQRAQAASERDAASARAALNFLTDAFSAAAPDNALSKTVSVRELLDSAKTKLAQDTHDPAVTRSMQRLLGRLYDSLGDSAAAVEQFEQGLAKADPGSREQALELAQDYDQYANLLGILDRKAPARAALDQAAALRDRFAAGDALAHARNQLSLAIWHINAGEGAQAIALLRKVLETPTHATSLPLDLEVRAAGFLSSQLTSNGGCSEAITVAAHTLAHLSGTDPRAADRQWLMRNRASALRACGKPAEAEAALRELIALQEQTIGNSGMRMLQLNNELALALQEQGRFREATRILATLKIPDSEGPFNRAALTANLAVSYENIGDYSSARQLLAQALALLDAGGIERDNDGHRAIERLAARAQALDGQGAAAVTALADLRERARRIDGEDSAEYANTTFQLAFAQQRTGRAAVALPLVEEAMRLWASKLPPTHKNLGLLHRLHAAIALDQGQLAIADQELSAAIAILEAGKAPASELALAQAEQAALRARQGRKDEARSLLKSALPLLREAYLPTQVGCVAAERLAHQLGIH
ncbi:MAG: protein kinase [Dokdonella sp.]|uniref:serine/threonine-protein kinase n=1 Tax=Dokdonella sp. TaxID=2291710 RepID=UPI0025B80634|nr:serine/threonine-protein kinase [Dokdonella sp.]MBZ0222039.1 protein kinase [Dokdonella sp.]